MSHGLLSAPLAFDVELGSLLLANMLSAWLDYQVVAQGNREAAHEPSQDHGASPGPVRLCSLEQLRERMPMLRQRKHALRAELQAICCEKSFDTFAHVAQLPLQ